MTFVRGKRSWICRLSVIAAENAKGGKAEIQNVSRSLGFAMASFSWSELSSGNGIAA
jgi:hypothetical protein